MRRHSIFLFALILTLFSKTCFAYDFITFPQDTQGKYALSTGRDETLVYQILGTGPQHLPYLADPRNGVTGIYIGAPTTALQMASRNAWMAILLHALSTGTPVNIIYSTDASENAGGINCTHGIGCILGVVDLTAK